MSSRRWVGGGDDIVTVDLASHPPNAPLGMLLAPGAGGGGGGGGNIGPTMSNVTLVAGWEHTHVNRDDDHDDGGGGGAALRNRNDRRRLGPVQRSGSVRLGDRLVRINGIDVTDWTFREVMDALREMVSSSPVAITTTNTNATTTNGNRTGRRNRTRLKTLGFAPSGSYEWSRGNKAISRSAPVRPPSEARTHFGMLLDHHRDDHITIHHEQERPSHTPSHVPVHVRSRYSFTSYVGRWRAFDDPSSPGAVADGPSSSSSPATHVRYEIRCHILFRDPTSLRLSSSSSSRAVAADGNNGGGGGRANDFHRTWSVWRRYSELRALDGELRSVHGWQMNAMNDGRGIHFPRPRSIESWWLGLGGGGGGARWGGRSSSSSPSFGTTDKNGTASMSGDDDVGRDAATRERRSRGNDDDDDAANDASPPPPRHPRVVGNCPVAPSFVDRRRGELAAYWTELMRIEAIFEFSDLEFGKTMATFLGVDDGVLLLARKGLGGVGESSTVTAATVTHQQQQQQQYSSSTATSVIKAFPFSVIHEHEETEMLPGISVGPSLDPSYLPHAARESPGLISSLSLANSNIAREILGFADDDVSILSDGTGADTRASLRGAANYRGFGPVMGSRPVVDVVPAHYDDMGAVTALTAVEECGDAVQPSTWAEGKHQIASPASAASSYVKNGSKSRGGSSRKGIGIPPHRTKPAFQRQFL
ncbi:hypothetical protein ACHAXA_011657 [Cyclostephanos tholiformis]|uniref:PDZ domain-containing protein n=1 Tax=Cyclostephanos tholiformis TaxID=382380 RepID=A0ABD3SES0_9STRA